jgi:hypothetical protein
MDNTSLGERGPAARGPTYAWWLVLCLVGLDYFSTLAYLPSIAVAEDRRLAPLAALAVVVVTLLGALPVYLYVVGRSPHGQGATGLLEKLVYGWSGKVFILVLLGFIATDFVVTRTLSVADASRHIIYNPYWKEHVEWVTSHKDTVRGWFPEPLQGGFFDFWNEQLVLTVILSVLAFGFYAFIIRGFNRPFMVLAGAVVGLFLLVNGVVVGAGLAFLAQHPERLQNWFTKALEVGPSGDVIGAVGWLALTAVVSIPGMALGLSGFELSMTSAPLVRGRPDDDPAHPRGRIRRTRLLLIAAALIMSAFILGSVLTVAQLVPGGELQGDAARDEEPNGPAMHRALAYLAHGGKVSMQYAAGSDKKALEPVPGTDVSPLFGPAFGTLYDLSTVLILCLAGASVTIGLRDLVPHYLARFGMQLHWAQKVGVILHLFNVIILAVTIVFRASIAHQQWAYAASVLVLMTGAGLAALLDLRRRWQDSLWMWPITAPFFLICLVFLGLVALTLLQSRTGLYIPALFILVLLGTAFTSRWLRSTELRFEGFDFADEQSAKRWEQICQLEFQVLVPHRPDHITLSEKDRQIRERHRLGPDVPIIFIEADLGDPSEFFQRPLMTVETREGLEVIRVARCASISHVIAAIGLEFRHVGRPPEVHFGWSDESPIAANLGFLLFGEGNIPLMVHSLIRKAEPDPERRPRVVIG